MERAFHKHGYLLPLVMGLMPATSETCENCSWLDSDRDADGLHDVVDDQMAYTHFNFKIAAGALPKKATADIVRHDLHCQPWLGASHWVGLTLPGIIEEPGSLEGMINS